MTFLWIVLGHYLRGMLDLFRADNVPQGALLDVLDRILLPDPVDRWRVDQTDSTRRRRGIGAGVFAAPLTCALVRCAKKT